MCRGNTLEGNMTRSESGNNLTLPSKLAGTSYGKSDILDSFRILAESSVSEEDLGMKRRFLFSCSI
jgi:hypothetical protein